MEPEEIEREILTVVSRMSGLIISMVIMIIAFSYLFKMDLPTTLGMVANALGSYMIVR